LAFNFIPYYHQNIVSTSIIGASGSVMAVVFAAATLAPDYSFFLFLIGSVRIKYIAFLLLIISLAGSIGANAGGEIVHLGGAIFGYIYIRQLRAGRDFSTPIEAVIEFLKNYSNEKNEPKFG
jgi:membrane associated rhomboid family serine protease